MRPRNQEIIGDIEECLDEFSACVGDLTRHVELSEGACGNLVCDHEGDTVVGEADSSSDPIEFITENGFSIVRPWESGNSPRPTGGRCRFSVSDGFIEREVTVQVSRHVVSEVSLRTRGRIQLSSTFWICCAERHLANYVAEHGDFPEDDELIVEELNSEDVLSALRWARSDE
jgi:hypothetical protein